MDTLSRFSNDQTEKTHPNFKALNSSSVIDYVKHLPELAVLMGDLKDGELAAEEIGDGNLNLVFRVYQITQPRSSVIIKQALPYLRLVGEGWPLTLDRARIEATAVAYYQSIIPQRVPHIYKYDEQLCLTVMEDLQDYIVLRKGLIEGRIYPDLAQQLGSFMAHTLFFSSDFYLDPIEKKNRVMQFMNPELCKITEDLIFDEPYRPGAKNNRWNVLINEEVNRLQSPENTAVLEGVFCLRFSFMTHTEALIHGDLHTGSVMVNGNDAKVIDPEFAFYGPIGFDVGAIIANFLLNYCSQPFHLRDAGPCAGYQLFLKNSALNIWRTFLAEWTSLWEDHARPEWRIGQERFKTHLARETLGFCGAKMIRRVVGLAHVADLESIANLEERAVAESKALRMGQWLVANHRTLETYQGFEAMLEQVFVF